MGLIKKPAEITAKRTASILIYGQPGIGKTTLACGADKPVLFDFDGGVGRIKAEHRVDTLQVTSWAEIAPSLQEVKCGGYGTIIIDTVGKMLECIEVFIKGTQPNMVQRDGTLSLKGYGVRKNIWRQFLTETSALGMSVLFIAHEKEEKQGDLVVKRADAGNATTANDLFKDLDLIGYYSAFGKKRTLDFCGSDIIYAKAPANMRKTYEVDVLTDDNGNTIRMNDYFARIIMGEYADYHEKNDELVKEYQALIEQMRAEVENINTPKDADKFCEKIQAIEPIFDSKLVARKMMLVRCGEIGIEFDADKGKFVKKGSND